MRSPLAFTFGNLVFGEGACDPWAGFELEMASYAWLGVEGKRRRLSDLSAALEACGADLQLLRVAGGWHAEPYLQQMQADIRRAQLGPSMSARALDHLQRHAAGLSRLGSFEARTFLFVSLREPAADLGGLLSSATATGPSGWWRWLRGLARGPAGGLLRNSQLEQLRVRAALVQARLAEHVRLAAVRTTDLQWLVRRGFCRGLGEPSIDGMHEPRALTFERNGEAVLAPLEGDVLRWLDSHVENRARLLKVESELGVARQALLVAGALPERVMFPGPRAELMFAPVENLPFAVDLCLCARYLPNEQALRLVRRRIQDADQVARAEAVGEQGTSDAAHARAGDARDLLSRLQVARRPALLRATLSLAVGAREEAELETRVESCRRAFGEVRLHRPLGEQLSLFLQHLPAQRTRVRGYDDTMTVQQVGAMMATATHRAGSERGFHLGHTLSGSRRPVRLNLREGSDRDRNTTILSLGALGSGKTTLAQKLALEGLMLGARVIDCDPKGDHRLHLLPELEGQIERIDLRPDPVLRGMLDPLRVAPAHMRQEAALSFLRALLPRRAEPAWETSLLAAVDRVGGRSQSPTCLEVVWTLGSGDETDRQVAKTLEIHARSGLTQLGFADPRAPLPAVGTRSLTYLPIRDLPSPVPGTPRADYTQAERVGEQIVRLIALFAMHLVALERDRLTLFCFDEGWRLLGDPSGRALLAGLQRLGRSELAVPIISTQLVSDALIGERDSLESLLGATFVFGVRAQAEAERALTLLGLDPADPGLRRVLLEMDAGRCLFRDHSGRIEAIQIDLPAPGLLRSLSTTPGT